MLKETTLQDILDKFNLDLPIPDKMKKTGLMTGDNPITEYHIDGNKYVFKGKLKNIDVFKTVVVDLDKMIMECDTSDMSDMSSIYEIYDEKGEVIEFGF